MNSERTPTQELRYQTELLERQVNLLERIRRDTRIAAIACGVFLLGVGLQCLVIALYAARLVPFFRWFQENFLR